MTSLLDSLCWTFDWNNTHADNLARANCCTLSLIHLMHAIACTHAGTCAASLMRVKNNLCPFCLWHLLPGHWNEENERTKTSNWIAVHFSLTIVKLLLTWMLYFHEWLQNKGKFQVCREYYNQFGIYQHSLVSLFKPRQNNLSNPEAYSEPCQACKIVKG